MGHVVAAIEVIVDKHFPIAGNVIDAGREIMQFADPQWGNSLDESSEETVQRTGIGIEVDDYKVFPTFCFHRQQAVLLTVKAFHSIELGHAFESAIQPIVPPVIGTVQK